MSTHKVKAAIAGSLMTAMMACTVCSTLMAGAFSGDSYQSWMQTDKSWSAMRLGNSTETVGQSGCAVTAAAMLMVKSGSVTDPDFTPADVVRCINAWGGFSDEGDIDFHKLSRYAPSFIYCQKFALSGTKQQKAEEMQRLMDEGYYLLAVVRNGAHFVAIDSVSGSEVTMMDPASKATNLFVHYAPAGVTELRLFRGANSRSNSVQEEMTAPPPAPTETTTPPAAAPAETMTVPEIQVLSPETPPFEEPAPENPPAPAETDAAANPAATTVTTTAKITAETTTTAAMTETKPNATEPERETTVVEDDPETPPMPESDPSETETDTPETPPMPAEEPQTVFQRKPVMFRMCGQQFLMKVQLTAASDLVLYAAPGTDAEHLLIIPEDAELEITEADSKFLWGKTAYAGKTGWIELSHTGL